ncbi:hypothetical protein BLNAU_4640 [Blattamonas nauphoetae]|uniref:ISXO2-like transposase domain-containing protein n=1 Tax=Blattamonas nauphoetae TaxID=2049346 RepID=A0ABQ9Y9I4_9EUKA|nr:hypothetical protein BLNAU_4640 [Blattamonas nauphoetae]
MGITQRQSYVVTGVERHSIGQGRCFIVPVPRRSAEILIPLIYKYIRPGSTIHSVEWRAYAQIDPEYRHLTLNHSVQYKNPATDACTNMIEGFVTVPASSFSLLVYSSCMGELCIGFRGVSFFDGFNRLERAGVPRLDWMGNWNILNFHLNLQRLGRLWGENWRTFE